MKYKFLFWTLDNENKMDRRIVFMMGLSSFVTIILLIKVIIGAWNYPF